MKFKMWLLENEALEQEALNRPEVQRELQDTGIITIKTLIGLGYAEPDANYLSRVLSKKYGNKQTYYRNQENLFKTPTEDEYLYHIALKINLDKIMKYGLIPNATATMTNYKHYSSGKVFLTELGGINFWKERVEAHEEHNSDDPQGSVVLQIPKSALPDLQADVAGTQDAKQNAWFTTTSIAPNFIKVVG